MFSLSDKQPMIIAALIVSVIVVFYLYKENMKLKALVGISKPSSSVPSILKKAKKVVIVEPTNANVEVDDVVEKIEALEEFV